MAQRILTSFHSKFDRLRRSIGRRLRLVAVCRSFALALSLFALVGVARAGGGPENVFVVVNPRSWASLTVANFFLRARQVPAGNVFFLDWDQPVLEAVPIDQFRQRILTPILETIDRRGLAGQIDYVVYAPDFPYHVYAQSDLGDQKLPQGFAPYGSLSSMTYLWQLVQAKNAGYMEAESNRYFRPIAEGKTVPPSQGFRGWYGWGARGEVLEGGGPRYVLSTLLAMTSGRGNAVFEAIGYLRQSALADESHPKGTIYYARSEDVRTQKREPLFAPAVATLEELGVKAEIFEGVLPEKKSDVQGLTLGVAKFDWARSGSTILPGAICDNLTSTAGFLNERGNQTALTEFLRYGAAGASGTVIEPLALPQKFPSPFIHVHYARGCSLAEAFYQSVQAPFQLLIVGDPLCRPWGQLPKVRVAGLVSGADVPKHLSLEPAVDNAVAGGIRRFQLFVDGRLAMSRLPGEKFELDTSDLVDGYHELTVVAIDGSPIENQGRRMYPIKVNNHQQSVTLSAPSGRTLEYGERLKLSLSSSGAQQVVVFHQGRRLGKLETPEGELEIDARVLGLGPVRLHAVAFDGAGEKVLAVSAPLELEIEPAAPLEGRKPPPAAKLRPGLELKLASARKVAVEETPGIDWLTKAGVKPNDKYTLSGYVQAPDENVYQFQFAYFGALSIRIDGVVVYQGNVAPQSLCPWHYLPITLGEGTHFVEIDGQPGMHPRLEMRFGGPGSWPIGSKHFRHAS